MEPAIENTYVTLEWGQKTVRHKDSQFFSPNHQTILAKAILRDDETDGVYGDVQLTIDHANQIIKIGRPRSLVKGIHYTRVLDLVTLILESGGPYTVEKWSR